MNKKSVHQHKMDALSFYCPATNTSPPDAPEKNQRRYQEPDRTMGKTSGGKHPLRLNDDSAELAVLGLYARLPYHCGLAAVQRGALADDTSANGHGTEKIGLRLNGRCACAPFEVDKRGYTAKVSAKAISAPP
jgi:hypothetical protein